MLKANVWALAVAGAWALAPDSSSATAIEENFQTDPRQRGWRTSGEGSLFRWDAQEQHLAVTWNSARENSYFYLPLGTILTRQDDFRLAFTLRLDDISVGATPGKPYTFEIALGLLNLRQATAPTFLRGTGVDSPNLVEWDYFPDSGFGATVATTMISTNHQWATGFNFPVELALKRSYRFVLEYSAASGTLTTSLAAAEATTVLKEIVLTPDFGDFRVDTLAVASYSDAGQDPQFAGSVLAHGVVDEVALSLPDPPVQDVAGGWTGGRWEVRFRGQPSWQYALEVSQDLKTWTAMGVPVPGVGGVQVITDPQPPPGGAFYRVRADRP